MNHLKSEAIIQMISVPEKAPIPDPPESHFELKVSPKDKEVAQIIKSNFHVKHN